MFLVSSHSNQLGIIGDPIEHSFSPLMHNFISDYTDNDYVYCAWHVTPEKLSDAINGVRALDIKGINVTAPHKLKVMDYIDEVSEQAKALGSVNTVVNRNGKLYGYNTDSDGFLMSLEKEGITAENKSILIFGAGGVTKPTVIRLIQENPSGITVVNRTKEKVDILASQIKEQTGFVINTTWEKRHYDIVINTTSAGMEPQEDKLPIDSIEYIDDLSFIDEKTAVIDMIYNPKETLFLKLSKERGAKILNGLGMLVYQGILSYELFTGVKLPDNMGELIKKEVLGQ